MGLADETTVQVHAWAETPDGDQEYADADAGEEHDGWSVFLRVPTPNDPQQPFDTKAERDFATRQEAQIYAAQLAATHKAEVDFY